MSGCVDPNHIEVAFAGDKGEMEWGRPEVRLGKGM